MKPNAAIALLVLTACGSSTAASPRSGDDGGVTNDGMTSDAGASRDAGVALDSGQDTQGSADASGAAEAGAVVGCDAGGCASLVGFVQRTTTQPAHGGIGSVYVAVFDGNPVTDSASAVVVARTLLPNEDLSAENAQVAYRIDDVPVQSTAYQVIAFLDDANAVSASDPAPASGDLISLDLSGGISGIPLTVSQPGQITLDLPLNAQTP